MLSKLERLLAANSKAHRIRLFSVGQLGVSIFRTDAYADADIIHLQWFLGGMLSIRALKKIRKPIVWTFRDMWPLTGGCHYSLGCSSHEIGCGKCPLIGSSRKMDITRTLARQKKRIYSSLKDFYPVAISPWLAETAEKSSQFKPMTVRSIWNGVDLSLFQRRSKLEACQELDLDPDHSFVAFGANNFRSPYKGGAILFEALMRLKNFTPAVNSWEFLVFGSNSHEFIPNGLRTRNFRTINDDRILNSIYAAADVFLFPSKQEAFGKTIIESMASGTPVVCFDSTGPKDMVKHRETGFKAKPFCCDDFISGILWAMSLDHHTRSLVSENCRLSAAKFSHLKAAEQYRDLYVEALNNFNKT